MADETVERFAIDSTGDRIGVTLEAPNEASPALRDHRLVLGKHGKDGRDIMHAFVAFLSTKDRRYLTMADNITDHVAGEPLPVSINDHRYILEKLFDKTWDRWTTEDSQEASEACKIEKLAEKSYSTCKFKPEHLSDLAQTIRDGAFGAQAIKARYFRLILVTWCELADEEGFQGEEGRVRLAEEAYKRARQGEGRRPEGGLWSRLTERVTADSVAQECRFLYELIVQIKRDHMMQLEILQQVLEQHLENHNKEQLEHMNTSTLPPQSTKSILDRMVETDDRDTVVELAGQIHTNLRLENGLQLSSILGLVKNFKDNLQMRDDKLPVFGDLNLSADGFHGHDDDEEGGDDEDEEGGEDEDKEGGEDDDDEGGDDEDEYEDEYEEGGGDEYEEGGDDEDEEGGEDDDDEGGDDEDEEGGDDEYQDDDEDVGPSLPPVVRRYDSFYADQF